MFTLRKAAAGDAAGIRRLIWKVHINPTSLDWRHFWVAVDSNDRLIGTGQVKPHRDGTFEMASIAVEPVWRRQGVASAIIWHLLEAGDRPHPLYLTCRQSLETFYERFGFRRLEKSQMPPELSRNAAIFGWLRQHLFPKMPRLLVMGIE